MDLNATVHWLRDWSRGRNITVTETLREIKKKKKNSGNKYTKIERMVSCGSKIMVGFTSLHVLY